MRPSRSFEAEAIRDTLDAFVNRGIARRIGDEASTPFCHTRNTLVRAIVYKFCAHWAPAGRVLYVGDTDSKFAYFDKTGLGKLGVHLEEHGKMPDVIIHYTKKNWLLLIEAVTSHGPVNPKRHQELKRLFAKSKAGLVYVTAFLTRKEMVVHLGQISWETEVWVAESPTHMIHFNGERFLGPYPDKPSIR
jgi:hypothetical protein